MLSSHPSRKVPGVCLAALLFVCPAVATAAAQPSTAAPVHSEAQLDRGAETGGLTLAADLRRGLTTESTRDPSVIASRYLLEHTTQFGLAAGSTLAVRDTTSTGDGSTAVRLRQEIQGVGVLGAEFVVQVDTAGRVLVVSGEGEPTAVDATPVVSAAEAEATAERHVAATTGDAPAGLHTGRATLAIFDARLIGGDETAGPRLVWSSQVRDDATLAKQVLVDARSGAVVTVLEKTQDKKDRLICDAGSVRDDTPCTSEYPDTLVEQGPLSQSVRDGLAHDDIAFAYDYTGGSYDFYLAQYGRKGIDGKDMQTRATVRYCEEDEEYDCPDANSSWSGNQLWFGEGEPESDDTVGHELTHGVTQYTSGLVYANQSGAINESMSDIFGELIDQATSSPHDSTSELWQLFEADRAGVSRSMSNPPAFKQPDSMTSPLFYKGKADDGGVHTNSGVGNKAAYLVAQGGTFGGVTVKGIGAAKMGQVFYRVNTTLLTSGSDYNDLGNAMGVACDLLVKASVVTADDCVQVRRAAVATGMVPDSTPIVTPTPVATPKPTATPVATPKPTATPVATPKPTAAPVATPTPTATPVATATPVPTTAATPTPTPTPVASTFSTGTAPLFTPGPIVSTPAPAPVRSAVSLLGLDRAVPVSNRGELQLSLSCSPATACSGAIAISAKPTKGRGSTLVYASGTYSVAAGGRGTAKLKLSSAGRTRLAKGKSPLAVTVTATPSDAPPVASPAKLSRKSTPKKK